MVCSRRFVFVVSNTTSNTTIVHPIHLHCCILLSSCRVCVCSFPPLWSISVQKRRLSVRSLCHLLFSQSWMAHWNLKAHPPLHNSTAFRYFNRSSELIGGHSFFFLRERKQNTTTQQQQHVVALTRVGCACVSCPFRRPPGFRTLCIFSRLNVLL